MSPFGAINSPMGLGKLEETDPVVAREIVRHMEEDWDSGGSRNPASISADQLAHALKNRTSKAQGALVRFAPENQVLHSAMPVQINIIDPQGIGAGYKLKIYYNKKDVTAQVLKGNGPRIHANHNQLDVDIKNIRFIPGRENLIYVTYQRTAFHMPVVAEYKSPQCALKGRSHITDVEELRHHRWIVHAIEAHAKEQDINPGLMVGLVAQESNFDPRAVSWAKAIGLTQVTSLANSHVMEKHVDWPSFDGLTMMSIPEIRMNIVGGRINHKNEWRLDVDKSIKGGMYYLVYLQDYWDKARLEFPSQRHQNIFNTSMSDVILASYNSGPYRVKKAIKDLGPRWQYSSDLKEARKYIARVKSYCSVYSEVGHDI